MSGGFENEAKIALTVFVFFFIIPRSALCDEEKLTPRVRWSLIVDRIEVRWFIIWERIFRSLIFFSEIPNNLSEGERAKLSDYPSLPAAGINTSENGQISSSLAYVSFHPTINYAWSDLIGVCIRRRRSTREYQPRSDFSLRPISCKLGAFTRKLRAKSRASLVRFFLIFRRDVGKNWITQIFPNENHVPGKILLCSDFRRFKSSSSLL